MKKIIIGIQVGQRNEDASNVQKILTDFGCIIKTRLGLHQQSEYNELCSDKGLIILELVRDCDEKATELIEKLSNIDEVSVRKMEF